MAQGHRIAVLEVPVPLRRQASRHEGSYSDLPLSAARQAAKELRAKVTLGHDVAGEKQERKTVALAKIEAARTVMTVAKLADEYFERMVLGDACVAMSCSGVFVHAKAQPQFAPSQP